MKRLFLCVALLASAAAVARVETVVADLSADDAVAVFNWTCVDGVLAAEEGTCRRIWYEADLPLDGLYAVDVAVSNLNSQAQAFSLGLGAGDAHFAAPALEVEAHGVNVCRFDLPWMPEGAIDLRLEWIEDAWSNRVLAVCAVQVVRIDGADALAEWWASATGDSDGDGISDVDEMDAETHVCLRDTDGDGLSDGDEAGRFGLSPLSASTVQGIADAEVVDERLGADYSSLTMHNASGFGVDGSALIWPSVINPSASYQFTTTYAGFHLLELNVRNQHFDLPEDYSFVFETLVNELNCGTVRVRGADFNLAGTGYCITPWLEPGTYTFRIVWKNVSTSAHRCARPAVEALRLLWVNGPDADGDGMQDWMKRLAQNMPIDRDGDGISDGREVLVFHTNPLKSDSDGDGLADSAENAIGTSPLNPDTDGDGISDGEEWLATGTDPLLPEFSANWTVVASLSATAAVSRVGVWSARDGSLSTIRRGSATYSIEAPSSDRYFLRVDASHFWHSGAPWTAPVERSRMVAYSGDDILGYAWLSHAPGSGASSVRFPLPFMQAGSNLNVRIVWDSVCHGLGVTLHSVSLESPCGPDLDGDGIQDWAEARSLRDDSAVVPQCAFFSPLCLEGTAEHPSRVFVSTGGVASCAVMTSPTNWYADVSLARGANTVAVSYDMGLRVEEHSVSWIGFDVNSGPSAFSARTGDTMLLTAAGATDVSVSRDGVPVESFALSQGETVELPLSDSGLWTLSAFAQGAQSAIVHTVNVLGGSFPSGDPALILGKARSWTCPDLPDGAVVSADSKTVLSRSGTNLTLNASSMFSPHVVVARVSPGGPILDVARIRPFWLRATVDTFVHRECRGADYEVWTDDVLTSEVPSSVSVVSTVVLGGVTLDNYSVSQTVCGSDIPSASHMPVRVLRPDTQHTSICHTVVAFQDGVKLGDAYRNNGTMPGDMK